MSEPPLVTVCMPTLGRLRYLAESQESLAHQTLTDREVIVLDNASPPEGRAAIGAWAAGRSDTRVLRTDTRCPVYANFNRGIRAARGKYVVFFHDDDRYHPRFLEQMVARMEDVPDAAIGGCNYDVIDGSGRHRETRRAFRRAGSWSGRRFRENVIGSGRCPIPMQGVIYRRRELGEGFDDTVQTHFGDFALLMRLVEDGRRIATCADILLQMRKHVGAASSIPMSRALPIRHEVIERYLDEYLVRNQNEAKWVQRMRRRHELNFRLSVAFAWATAPDADEARACAELLGSERLFDRLGSLLMSRLAPTRARPAGLSRLARDLLTR